jgi:hypothetical protein
MILTETTLTLSEAALVFPGGPVHVNTLRRWSRRGFRGIVLETFWRGNTCCTSREAIARFIEKTTAAAGRKAVAHV